MKNDFSLEFQEKYGGRFVALRGNKVIAAARTYGALERKLSRLRLGKKVIDIMRVPRPDGICAY